MSVFITKPSRLQQEGHTRRVISPPSAMEAPEVTREPRGNMRTLMKQALAHAVKFNFCMAKHEALRTLANLPDKSSRHPLVGGRYQGSDQDADWV